ncbi:pentatricopeptide repeat-containing protein At2g13600-like [Selaginella moellendorffii]|uniref:pentatricopeptide repeat-containing protein At2g13600-like n=1 Tax=Selaginella moellendorffii TaxID=88036 RepID=UPI000D1C4F94|nr:pentatricopeptide repeat-containing protein At2g13600-like [Selaginella moellendorffii]XP_024526341.1 pentatricopeptide repeat-containing protein At2g13600-like [Selaginella moellendorffii]|eukprot:XP_024526340.1 pentatricopeptide repeat-containing protein At2g13600-like [Selaginella moellendorffii]
MYAKCGSMEEARRVFERIREHDLVSWNTIILGYAENGGCEEALELFSRMEDVEGLAPNRVTFLAAIKACSRFAAKEEGRRVGGKLVKLAALETGREIHARTVRSGLNSDIFVASTLVDMYAKCGSLVDARAVFDRMVKRDVVTWNSIMLGYAEGGDGQSALDVFSSMRSEGDGCAPDSVTFIALLKACSDLAEKERGEKINGKAVKVQCLEKVLAIHSLAARDGCGIGSSVANTLISTYAGCGSLVDASGVFHRMIQPTLVSWNAMILAYAENGEGGLGLELFVGMQSEGFRPNRVTFLAALKACAAFTAERLQGFGGKMVKLTCLEQAMAIHSQAMKCGCKLDHFLANSLIFVYSQCGSLMDSQRVFDKMRTRDVASWSALIQSYTENKEGEVAVELFWRMQEEGWTPDRVTYLAAVKACLSVVPKVEGKQVEGKAIKACCFQRVKEIHSRAAKTGLDQDIFVASSLVDAYAKCGNIGCARRAFDGIKGRNLVLWNTLILGYAENGDGESALELFDRMQIRDRILPDARSYVAVLKACASAATRSEARKPEFLLKGRDIHSRAVSMGLEMEMFVASSLVDMYVKCGSLEEAREVFDRTKHRDTVSWTAMIMGYQENGESGTALELYSRMLAEGCCSPDCVTFVAVLKACGSLAAMATGREVHALIRSARLDMDPIVGNSLVDFYGKCGSMVEAERVFATLEGRRDSVTWNALIAGYSHQGNTAKVFESFERMQEERCKPDAVTFLSVLTACSHAGLVDRGRELFETMKKTGDLALGIEHYSCMVDLLGRANRIEEAVGVLRSMPVETNVRIWMAVLAACAKWKNVEFGRVAFEEIVRMEEKKAAAYVLMANIYSAAGRWEEHAQLEQIISRAES